MSKEGQRLLLQQLGQSQNARLPSTDCRESASRGIDTGGPLAALIQPAICRAIQKPRESSPAYTSRCPFLMGS